MKLLHTIILSILLFCSTYSQADQTTGVHLQGMYPGHRLSTIYNPAEKLHTLNISAAEGYIDLPIFSQFMHLEGDSTVIDATGEYSTKTAFVIKPPAGEIYYIARMIVSYKDVGSFDSGFYGNSIVLVNGLDFWFRQNGVDVLNAFKPPFYIIDNTDWAAVCYDTRVDTYGQGESQLVARFTFTKFGKYLKLDGNAGDEFVVYLQDDFTGLNSHKFLMQGFRDFEVVTP